MDTDHVERVVEAKLELQSDRQGAQVRRHCGARADGLGHARLDQAKADRIHIDVVTAPFLCQCFCQSDNACLACGVACLAGIATRPGNRRDIHDFAHHALAACYLPFGGIAKMLRSRAQ